MADVDAPRSCKGASKSRSDNGNRTYLITASGMTTGDVLKHRSGELGSWAKATKPPGQPQVDLL